MNTVLVTGFFILAAILEIAVLYFLLEMLKKAGAVRKNYQGHEIPVSLGISFPFTVAMVLLLGKFFNQYDNSYLLYIFGLMSICLLGFIDDMLGQRDTLGFKGHFRALLREGRLTTGGLKALGGGFIAFFLAFHISSGWVDLIVNTLVMALFTNMLNLFDLRPGRAIKAYIVFLLLLGVLARGELEWLLLAPLLGAVISYFYWDLKAMAMMGDAGSNVMGLSLGYLCALNLSLEIRAAMLVFLILLHLYTEKYSLSGAIDNVAVLRKIDRLGRRESSD